MWHSCEAINIVCFILSNFLINFQRLNISTVGKSISTTFIMMLKNRETESVGHLFAPLSDYRKAWCFHDHHQDWRCWYAFVDKSIVCTADGKTLLLLSCDVNISASCCWYSVGLPYVSTKAGSSSSAWRNIPSNLTKLYLGSLLSSVLLEFYVISRPWVVEQVPISLISLYTLLNGLDSGVIGLTHYLYFFDEQS